MIKTVLPCCSGDVWRTHSWTLGNGVVGVCGAPLQVLASSLHAQHEWSMNRPAGHMLLLGQNGRNLGLLGVVETSQKNLFPTCQGLPASLSIDTNRHRSPERALRHRSPERAELHTSVWLRTHHPVTSAVTCTTQRCRAHCSSCTSELRCKEKTRMCTRISHLPDAFKQFLR